MAKLFANSRDPDQMLLNAASDLGLHCLQLTILGASRLKWMKFTVGANSFYRMIKSSGHAVNLWANKY